MIILFVIVLGIILFLWSNSKTANSNCSPQLSQKLWIDHVAYTREYLIRYIYKLPSVNETATRLLKNQDDLASMVDSIYPGTYEVVRKLLRDHIIIATKLLEAIVNKTSEVNKYNQEWVENAKEIAKALSGLNKKYSYNEVENMMLEHLKTTSDEITALINKESGIKEYEIVLNHILNFSDYLQS